RFTIILCLPYDRPNTTMRKFKMCSECYREYTDPSDRRFHAQPNACPVCGPYVELYTEKGKVAERDEALKLVVDMLKQGKILSVKGLGGFHLICDATNEETVKELRRRKRREEKPFAVMFRDINQVKEYAEVSELEEIALNSVETPIVILDRKNGTDLAPSVSPDTDTVGAFLPYTPLHHLILRDFGKPIVATSCNLTDEPMVKENSEAVSLIGKLTDGALVHNRDIARRCDDSVVTVMAGKVVPIRRSRGYAPLPVLLPFSLKRSVLALGVHMKCTVAVAKGEKVYLSQHIGDVDNLKAEEFFKETVEDFLRLFDVEPEVVVCDRHPGYFSTKFGEKLFGERLRKVYHHHAHVISVMAENEILPDEKVIGLAFDGTGYGADGTIWGGEVLVADYFCFDRVFHLLPFKLPGGDRAVKEPYRVAVSLLEELGVNPDTVLGTDKKKILFVREMVRKSVNSPLSSSMGRLFDAVSAILGLKEVVSYHAQGAIVLEQVAGKSGFEGSYRFEILDDGNIDWRPVIEEILRDKSKLSVSDIAMKFHNAVVNLCLTVADRVREEKGINIVAMSGGVFQNRILVEKLLPSFIERGFKPLIHQIVPPNDGGISLGQAVYGGLC
ncbi:MAG: carbamoyltransferase HypF, partial [Desulfurobacteriaceae bacterium]